MVFDTLLKLMKRFADLFELFLTFKHVSIIKNRDLFV